MIFSKYQSLGNDYLIYDCNRNKEALSDKIIAHICDRHYGIGADGILVGPHMTSSGISVDIYNSDGTEASQSGNGILIFAKYLKDAGYIQKKEFELITKCGSNSIRYHNELGTSASVCMGKLDFSPNAVGYVFCDRDSCLNISSDNKEACKALKKRNWELVDIPMDFGNITYRCTCVSIGNPHCVLPYRVVNKVLVCDMGKIIEQSPYFANQINTEIAQIIDRHNINIEIYERGSGYTLASGSSACAAVGALFKMGLVDNKVNVSMPGGTLLVSIDNDLQASLTGKVNPIGDIRLFEEYILFLYNNLS